MAIILNGHHLRTVPGIRVIVLMLVSIAIAGAIVAAMLIDALAAPPPAAASAAGTDSAPLAYCTTKAVHRVLYPIVLIDARC
jgi:hypothetical protein